MQKLVQETSHTKNRTLDTPVHVIDSIMGSGKKSWSIQYMNESAEDTNFIYITPFLSEVQRVKESVTTRKFTEPTNKGKGKLDNLKKLIVEECDIASTHALFEQADEELIQLIKAANYTLILDEAMNVVEQCELNKDSFQLLLDTEMIYVDETTGIIRWNDEAKYQDTPYNNIKNLAKTENLYFFENTILFWTFPVSTFQAFNKVFIMTYLFQCQQQKYYYDMYNVQYSYKAVQKVGDRYALINHESKEPYDKTLLKSLINIHEGKLNNIGDENFALSLSWFRKDKIKHLVTKLKKNIYTYFRRTTGTPAINNMWTTFKDYQGALVGNGYKGVKHKAGKPYKEKECFVPHNLRATNDFVHKSALVYAVNRFMNPYEKKFFLSKGVEVNEELYALSELIQWIWRSRIRDGKPINLYIPSKRMRNILMKYLESDL
jgi:hypothetical protein